MGGDLFDYIGSFQFTPLREGRRKHGAEKRDAQQISILAPA